jgi:hypothetical protein
MLVQGRHRNVDRIVELRRFIGSGIAASAIGHLSALAMVLIFAEVHPFSSVTAEPIAVDIVAPEEVGQNKPEQPPIPKEQPSHTFDLSSQSAASSAPAPAASPAAATPPQNQAALSAPRPDQQPSTAQPEPGRQQAGPQPQPDRQQAAAQPQPPATSAAPAYTPPEPDLSIKYHVMLGLPPVLPPSLPQDKPGDGFDAAATTPADIASSLVAEFRRHLRTCSKLPESIAASDAVRIKLRVLMTLQGTLAAEPVLIEASASMKGPTLMQSAIKALQACQPYAMLPADRYGEWKVLDLSFTPRDFAGG